MTGSNDSGRQPSAGSKAVRSGEKATGLRYSLMDLARTRGDVISLGRGDPDLHTPGPILDGALKHFEEGAYQADADEELRGLRSLRRGIADRLERERGVSVDPESEIVVTNGAQEGLFLAVLALVDPGDRVVCPEPRYTSYDQAIGAAGGEIVSIPTGGDEPFELSAESLREHGAGAKLLVFVNPSNPTGAFVGPDGVRALAKTATEMGLVVLSDEIYEDLVFDGAPFLSFLATGEEVRDRSVLLSGFSKSYAMTGFRVGYLVGPPAFVDAVAAMKATTSGACPAFSQLAALSALEADPDPRPDFLRLYEGRRRVLLDGFDEMGIPYGPQGGGLFMWADVSRFGLGAEEFCYRLLDEAGVLMFPGNSFGERWTSWVRVSLLAPEESVREAMERMRDFVAGLDES